MFELAFPQTVDEALSGWNESSRWFAGGTDLVPELKTDLVAPSRLVNLKQIAALRGIQETNDGLRIAPLTTLSELAANEQIQTRYRAFARACELVTARSVRPTSPASMTTEEAGKGKQGTIGVKGRRAPRGKRRRWHLRPAPLAARRQPDGLR